MYSVLGHEVGETVAHIRVPATYRYHIELAPKWKVSGRMMCSRWSRRR